MKLENLIISEDFKYYCDDDTYFDIMGSVRELLLDIANNNGEDINIDAECIREDIKGIKIMLEAVEEFLKQNSL